MMNQLILSLFLFAWASFVKAEDKVKFDAYECTG